MKIRRAVLGVFLLATTSLFAQSLKMGNEPIVPNAGLPASPVQMTLIDLVHPANATGTVTTAKFHWSNGACANAVKIKFFRRNGNTVVPVAERGPFTTTSTQMTVTLTPPVNVLQGDLVGIARVAACGSPGVVFGFPSEGFLRYDADVTSNVDFGAGSNPGSVLAVSASGSATESVARVIPVAGSTPGNFGSFFKTGVQLMNPNLSGAPITGRLIFHRAGLFGRFTDPSISYSLAPGQVIAYPDIVAAMGQSGVGSLDLLVPQGMQLPVIITRLFNDAGALGTTGLYQEALDVSDASFNGNKILYRGVTGFLITPEDPTKTRMNIGVRTLFSGATITATLKGSAGETLRTVTRTYAPQSFEQISAESFLGIAIGPNQTITISIGSGSAIVYGSSTDNITNDPAIQFVYGVFAIA